MKSFIFTLIFVLITSPSGFSRDTNNDDACARISTGYEQSNRDPEFSANYSDVKACFEAFPYDREIAEDTIETIKKTLQGFFVYLSQAKEEPKQGYSFRSVDLIKELDSLLLMNYTSEFQFMLNVNNLIAELKDPHLRFIPLCYQKFIYSQQLSLYSVINKEGVQIIKIFDDEIDSNNVDCEVTHIDGRPSMEVIKEFAEERIDISKDSGVRFNDALASLRINEIGDRILSARMFTLRNVLPEKSSIEYSLLCANDINTTFTREWKIGSVYYDRFNTTDDFRNAFCLKNEIIDESVNVSKMFEPKIYNKPMVECELVYATLMATFYILSDNKTGVVVVPNVKPSDDDIINQIFELQTGFSLLEDLGVTNLILDFHNNGGGFIVLALFFVYLLFPDSSPSFDNDMVVTELSRATFEAATSQSNEYVIPFDIPPSTDTKDLVRWAATIVFDYIYSTSFLDVVGYKDPNTGKTFSTVEEFIGNNTYIRGGTPTSFTSKFVDKNSQGFTLFTKLLAGHINEYKWKSKDVVILTNGHCGSSCSLITHRMAEKFNVSTIAVGGYKDTPLSYASFPGSQVYDFDSIYNDLNYFGLLQNETLKGLIPPPFKIPVRFTFTIKEIYDINNKDDVLEYIYKPAKYRLYYDEESARDPSKLWLKATKIFT